MSTITVPIAAHFLTGSILTLVMPLGVLIVVATGWSCCGAGGAANAEPAYSAASFGTSCAI